MHWRQKRKRWMFLILMRPSKTGAALSTPEGVSLPNDDDRG